MAAAENYLVRHRDGLVLLFTPPFDHANLDPGYIFGGPSCSGSSKRAYAPLTGQSAFGPRNILGAFFIKNKDPLRMHVSKPQETP